MLEIKSAKPTMRPNLILLPVTQTNDIKEFNEIYLYWKGQEAKGNVTKGITFTKSGGISIKDFKPQCYDIRVSDNLGAELIVLSFTEDYKPAFYRLQYRTAKTAGMSGRVAFQHFENELAKDGIDIQDYFISSEEGRKIKQEIEKPMIQLLRDSYQDYIFKNAHHLDIRSSYPSGMAEFIPEWRPTIERLYYSRNIHPENKAILNMACGYFQSLRDTRIRARLAHISKYAIHRNNEKINQMLKYLEDNGRIPIAINTDGIWFIGDKTNIHSTVLGEFNEDHTDCQIRFKSAGAYEFIENGIYTVKMRGHTRLDSIKPREQWQWGDIYQDLAEVKKLKFDKNKGITEVKDEDTANLFNTKK